MEFVKTSGQLVAPADVFSISDSGLEQKSDKLEFATRDKFSYRGTT
jgi:hypothetical protein